MLTRRDLRNLWYLIFSKLRGNYHSARSVFKRLHRKIKAGRLFAKPEPLTPDIFLPIIRNTYPTLISGELASEFAKGAEDLGTVIETPFDEIIIDGGATHDMLRGFYDRPWRLVHQTGSTRKHENNAIAFKVVSSRVVLDELRPRWRVDLPVKKREEWEAKIAHHADDIEALKAERIVIGV